MEWMFSSGVSRNKLEMSLIQRIHEGSKRRVLLKSTDAAQRWVELQLDHTGRPSSIDNCHTWESDMPNDIPELIVDKLFELGTLRDLDSRRWKLRSKRPKNSHFELQGDKLDSPERDCGTDGYD